MKVYVAYYFDSDDGSAEGHIVGVYYNQQDAEQAIDRDQHRGHGLYYYSDLYEIEEFEVE